MDDEHDIEALVENSGSAGFYWSYFLLIVLPKSALTIASLAVLTNAWNNSCDWKMMSLQTWLLVFILFESIYLIISGIGAYFRKVEPKVFKIGFSFNVIFTFIWNIVGAVALFRDSTDCHTSAFPLWSMVLSIICIQWIVWALTLIFSCCLCWGLCVGMKRYMNSR